MDEREVIWFALHDALPSGWTLGQATHDGIHQYACPIER
jgi:hypothetical protein